MKVPKLGWVTLIGAATATAVFGFVSFQANAAPTPPPVSDPSPGPEPVVGKGNDPLTTSEVDKAKAAALTPALAASAKDVTGAAGAEYLSSEIVEDSTGRKAEVYFYDYRTNKLVKQVVNLGTGKVDASFTATKMQPPAADREVATAMDLVLADPAGADLRAAYQRATGKACAGKEAVTAGAHVYKARPADTGAVARCGEHRCLQLVVQATGGKFIDVNDIIIDLSGRSIARLK